MQFGVFTPWHLEKGGAEFVADEINFTEAYLQKLDRLVVDQ